MTQYQKSKMPKQKTHKIVEFGKVKTVKQLPLMADVYHDKPVEYSVGWGKKKVRWYKVKAHSQHEAQEKFWKEHPKQAIFSCRETGK